MPAGPCSFYQYMSPLTPISPPSFQDPSTHRTLLAEEPILAVTLLTISSRYMRLSGPGALSRAYAIHEKLWNYLRGMIERIVWGQEQFGAASGGPHKPQEEIQTSSTAPWRGLRKGSLRTLGTVESLMLLTEWHPRALHFPPGDDGDELVIDDYRADADGSDNGSSEGPPAQAQRGIGGKRIESWLEPAWRSDRMCWMLLGNALALSFELGIFDATLDDSVLDRSSYRPEYQSPAYLTRATQLRNLILVYLTQLSGRLDWPNPCDGNVLASLRLPALGPGDGGGGGSVAASDFSNIAKSSISIENTIQLCWIEVTTLMRKGNELLFPTRDHTRDLIRTGRYTDLLEHFQPLLKDCRRDLDRLNRTSPAQCFAFGLCRALGLTVSTSSHLHATRPEHRVRVCPGVHQFTRPASRRRALCQLWRAECQRCIVSRSTASQPFCLGQHCPRRPLTAADERWWRWWRWRWWGRGRGQRAFFDAGRSLRR